MCSLVSVQRISNGSTASLGRNSAPLAAQRWWSRPAGGQARQSARRGLPREDVLALSMVRTDRRGFISQGRSGHKSDTRHRKKVDAGGLGRFTKYPVQRLICREAPAGETGLERFHTAEVAGSSPAAPTRTWGGGGRSRPPSARTIPGGVWCGPARTPLETIPAKSGRRSRWTMLPSGVGTDNDVVEAFEASPIIEGVTCVRPA